MHFHTCSCSLLRMWTYIFFFVVAQVAKGEQIFFFEEKKDFLKKVTFILLVHVGFITFVQGTDCGWWFPCSK